MWSDERGDDTLNSGAHYSRESTRTSDGKWLADGAMEAQFYTRKLLELLDLDKRELAQESDKSSWPEMKKRFRRLFEDTKYRDEWAAIFEGTSA